MQAIRFHEHGDIDVLKLEETPDPSPVPGEVLVEVRTCALNYRAFWQRLARPGAARALPGAARRCQALPGAARRCQALPGAARRPSASPAQPGGPPGRTAPGTGTNRTVGPDAQIGTN